MPAGEEQEPMERRIAPRSDAALSSIGGAAHRPWPLPASSWLMGMGWEDLLFAHWPVDPERLASLLPGGLELQTWGGAAWLGVVPFLMRRTHLRGLPPMWPMANFAELNLRTYVDAADGESRPGVWFFSLDAASRLAVRGARTLFHLPYFDARMRVRHGLGGWIDYVSERTHRGAPSARFAARYRPTGPVYHAEPETLEHWLTERYCLYAADRRGAVWRSDVHHRPWPLQPAEVEIRDNTLGDWIGAPLEGPPALVHFSRRIDVVGWGIERVGR
jgi:hypothetical protein